MSSSEDSDDDCPPPAPSNSELKIVASSPSIVESEENLSKIKLKKVKEEDKKYVSLMELLEMVGGKITKRELSEDSKYAKFKSLNDFGYKYTDNFEPHKKFEFVNQEHYDWLSIHILQYIFKTYQEKFGLVEKWIPEENSKEEKEKSFLERKQVNLYHSKNAFTTDDTLVVFINGAGFVRAGIWSLKICINDGLIPGTIFPFLKKCESRKWEVLVLNPNRNKTRLSNEKIPCSEDHEKHVLYCYDKFIKTSKAKKIIVIAHSYGGILTLSLLKNREEIMDRLVGVCFTDSVHLQQQVNSLSEKAKKFLMSGNCRNWSTKINEKRVGIPMDFRNGIETVSAGTDEHIWTSYKSMDSIFQFLDEKFKT